MNKFNYTPKEKCLLNCAIKNNIPWSDPRMKPVRDKIKYYYLQKQNFQCCYCKRKLTDFNFENHIEHILPKSKYKKTRFSPFNLAVSCPRCNLKIKKADISFLAYPFECFDKMDSDSYHFLHPNLDIYEHHIAHKIVKLDQLHIEKYLFHPMDSKAQYTYCYFELRELECESINVAQGLPPTEILNCIFSQLKEMIGRQP